ncbi:MAG: hypothetical protein HXS41_14360 [Theionarchaea archaeon]|nr:hypothetical protein [Theionarchaea archaeon]MBU7001458.1 hypothetical protein [Theionarchaea archaeon]MBU7022234.1 hypothetical protein [Theionarchaea archaeon]MBU7035116.1 hypothetical protein [Theionarchaea archaeon]MBU7040250.1 hypothetical protein [Theionarchaea archaeon]
MILGHAGILQETASDVLRDLWNAFSNFILTYLLYILVVILLVTIYFVVTRVFLRGSVYKTASKEPMCMLTMSGRERSLEYLERFGELRGIEVQIINYLRKNKTVPKRYLEKTFGAAPVRKLIDENMIRVV